MGEGGSGRGAGWRTRVVGLLAITAMLVTACGARLTDEQRAAGIGGSAGGGPIVTDPNNPTVTDPNNPTVTDPNNPTVTDPNNPTVTDPNNPTAPGPTGPLTASDVGVTPEKITIATIADVSGIQPGLFKTAHQAMQAFVAFQNSQGGILGRQLELLLLDSKVDAGATRTAVLDACDKAFALVGNMGAFDNGGAKPVDDCKIPDLSAITTTPERYGAEYSYPMFPNGGPSFIQASGRIMKEQFPSAIKKASQLWLNSSTTRYNAGTKREAYTDLGFKFIYTAETQVVEANYTPFVQKMKDRGVEFVTMLSDYQSIVRLVKAMQQQRWRPEILEWDSVVYSPKFLEDAEGAAEGSYVYINTAMLEEIDQNPEMQLYAQWLARIAPGAQPDYFGLYAWSAGRFFAQAAQRVGVDLTREKLITEVKKVHAWDGNGLHAAHDIGRKLPSRCTMYVKIENNRFVRHFPASGFACNKGGLYFTE